MALLPPLFMGLYVCVRCMNVLCTCVCMCIHKVYFKRQAAKHQSKYRPKRSVTILGRKVKISLLQAMEAHRVARG
jgi:hypothetical protein